jgi:hypothetical protein
MAVKTIGVVSITERDNGKVRLYLFENDGKYQLIEKAWVKFLGKEREVVNKKFEGDNLIKLWEALAKEARDKVFKRLVLNPKVHLSAKNKAYVRQIYAESLKKSDLLDKFFLQVIAEKAEEVLKDKVKELIDIYKERGVLEENYKPVFEKSILLKERALAIAEYMLSKNNALRKIVEELKEPLANSLAKVMLEQPSLTLKQALELRKPYYESIFESVAKMTYGINLKELIDKEVNISRKLVVELIEDITDKNIEEIVGKNKRRVRKKL